MSKVRLCKRCGQPITGPHTQANYCDICRPIIHMESWNRVKEERIQRQQENAEEIRKEREAQEKKKHKGPSITDIDKAAKAAGMSYGKYVAKYGV